MSELYIGLMSGTSLDGVDAVLADFATPTPRLIAHCSSAIPAELRSELLALNLPGDNELHRAALAGNALARLYAQHVNELLQLAQVAPGDVTAIGAHGQTVRHRPQEFDGTGYTLQLNQPSLLAELCGITVVADFRTRDVAAGGQGAPLVPPFHQHVFGKSGNATAVLNIGGISNVTLLPAQDGDTLSGFDCGPGNALMDGWCLAHTGAEFDDGGRWAAGGRIQEELLADMLADPFFIRPPPKSTGRDLFNTAWLQSHLVKYPGLAPQEVQATLAELTAMACAYSVQRYFSHCKVVLVCGGGVRNGHLMSRLSRALPDCEVASTDSRGLPAQQVEAMAFAWLAYQTVAGRTGSVKSVTGAQGARILGGIYPA